MLRPVPKPHARQDPEIPDPVWQHPDAICLITASSGQLLATIEQLTQTYDLDPVESLLWIVEDACRHLGIPPLVYPAADSDPISPRYTEIE